MSHIKGDEHSDIIEQLESSAINMAECRQEPMFLNERYLCCEQIGEGGLSVVYRAKDSYAEYFNDTRNIALKMPTSELLKMKDIAAFVYAEYRILNRLQHPSVVKVHDFGINKDDATPYIVMERLVGRRLDEVPLYALTSDEKISLLEHLVDTIGYLHTHGVIHADITPNNIMLLEDGSIRLFDFGISQFETKEETLHLDFSKMRAFNTVYAAPEILEGGRPSRSSDIFSLALMMYELFSAEELSDTEKRVIYQSGLKTTALEPLPREVRAWFKAALNPNPSKREMREVKQRRRFWLG